MQLCVKRFATKVFGQIFVKKGVRKGVHTHDVDKQSRIAILSIVVYLSIYLINIQITNN